MIKNIIVIVQEIPNTEVMMSNFESGSSVNEKNMNKQIIANMKNARLTGQPITIKESSSLFDFLSILSLGTLTLF